MYLMILTGVVACYTVFALALFLIDCHNYHTSKKDKE